MDSRSPSNYDTAQEDIQEFHIDYSSGGEGAPEPETNRTKNGKLKRPKEEKEKGYLLFEKLKLTKKFF